MVIGLKTQEAFRSLQFESIIEKEITVNENPKAGMNSIELKNI